MAAGAVLGCDQHAPGVCRPRFESFAGLRLFSRDLRAELMDQEGLDERAQRRALAGLARINAWSRSSSLLWRAIEPWAASKRGRVVRLVDIASGAGDVTIGLWRRAARAGIEVEATGIDISPVAVDYARARAKIAGANVRFEVRDIFAAPLGEQFDAAVSSLFLHHLTEEQAIDLLRRMAASAAHCVAINDLRRSRAGMVLAHAACRLLSRSPIVHSDGPQSVAAAFTLAEMRSLFERANLEPVQVRAFWPARQLAIWNRT